MPPRYSAKLTAGIQLDRLNQRILVKNFKWEGFLTYARLRSSTFGSLYIGNGIPNLDVYFTL